MGSVLAQDEVDALLAGVASDEIDIEEDEDEYDPSEVVPFDLTAQDRIIRGRMPTLEIIHDLEPSYRGLFGRVVGYFDFEGNSDLAIAIRTALIQDGVAHIQAGAGIVLDSVPESEHAETEAKAAVVLRAVAAAISMHND